MSDAEDIAKAVQSVAKFGEKSLETSEKLDGFIALVRGQLLHVSE